MADQSQAAKIQVSKVGVRERETFAIKLTLAGATRKTVAHRARRM